MNKDTNEAPPRRRWADLRFCIIGSLLAAPPERGELRAALERLAGQNWRHPSDGRPVRFGVSTIERWYYRALGAKADPVGALARAPRKDRGRSLVMSVALRAALAAQHREHPRWSYKLHADNLAALAAACCELGSAPSYSTVRRYLQANGMLRSRRRTGGNRPGAIAAHAEHDRREVRSYEAAYVGGLWHLDFHQGSRSVLCSDGKWHRPHLFGVLDDRSRLCCHLQWYLNETAENLVHGLSQAFLKRGLPRALMTDNGSAMVAEEVGQGLARLSVVHNTTLPYTPEQNAKQEVFWAQVEGRLMAMLDAKREITLRELNEATAAWFEIDYNRRAHREIGCRPVDRYLQGPDVMRTAPAPEDLRLAFTCQTSRSVRRSDGTLSLGGTRLEVPWQYRHLPRLTVRWANWDRSLVVLVDGDSGAVLARLYPLDKTRNAEGRRRLAAPPIGTVQATDNDKTIPVKDEIAPLLRSIIAEYAATGLVPAYLPKDETAPEQEGDQK